MTASHQTVRGFKDLLPPESERASAFEALARETLELYGFREIRLPVLEMAELFVKATGETTDIVEKEMFQLEDQGGRRLALRPEGTPGVVRAYLQHSLGQQGGVSKLYYVGSMFRAERPQAGRFREFEQIGAECIGNPHPAADVESILSLARLFDRAGVGSLRLRLNNIGCDDRPECRPRYRKSLKAYLAGKASQLCENCRRRIERNPLRALDCKADAPKLADAPRLEPCGECRDHFAFVWKALNPFSPTNPSSLPRIIEMMREPDGSLVRGLDYYTRTVFEFQRVSSAIGAQDALAGGGRYDGLVESMGGPKVPAVGWALGVERTLAAARGAEVGVPAVAVYVASAGPDAAERATALLESLRREGVRAEGSLFGKKLDAQLREAGRRGARFAAILGAAELAKGVCTLKDMSARTQREVPLAELPAAVRDSSLEAKPR